jgi:non-lysosomal glucosylceramidase
MRDDPEHADDASINRRDFLVSTSVAALSASTLAQALEAQVGPEPHAFRSAAGSIIPYSKQDLYQGRKPRTLTGGHLSEIAFPLGGIGTGTVSLGGRGQLRDWEIFNRPGKGKILPFSFVALWTRPEGASSTVRVVEGPLGPPFHGAEGFHRESAEGLPRFRGARFTGAYPFATIEFDDESLPIQVSLEAFNPCIPLNVDDSSLPVAILRYHLRSRSKRPVDAALAFSLLNAVGYDGKADLDGPQHAGFGKNLNAFRVEETGGVRVQGLDMSSGKYGPDDVAYGSMALMTTSPRVTAATAWADVGDWWDAYQKWYDEFAANGELRDAGPPKPSEDGRSTYATLAPRVRLAPGESQTVTFLLAWYFPVRENYWNAEKEVKGQHLKNDYGTRFQSAWDIGRHTATRLTELEGKTRAFSDTFYSASLPGYVLEAVSSQAAIIRTNTCMLLEGKQFFAFEGCDDNAGCCPMNCTHVWNYEQALAALYPELERSMRRTDFLFNMRADDSMAFRTLVPVGRAQWDFRPAADGQMGSMIKLYREWQVSGDDEFLKEVWPAAKRALEFAWTHWDADRDGLFEGEQHNTYDIEFYGPNPMMSTLYQGALRAAELMASAVGDVDAATSYQQVRARGITNLEQLWKDGFYIQKVPPADQIRPMTKYADASWHASAIQDGQVRYQFGDGCLSDQLLGMWMATVVGLEPGWSPARTRQALQSIYRYNFRTDFYDHANTQRIYALNDEKGLLLCSWPHGGRPALPFPYSDEVWTGIEFQVAGHMIYEGLIEEGLAIVKGVVDRYDGARRNPWDQFECGHHYARALASWSVLQALAGYRYSAKDQTVTFAPQLNADDFRCFFAAGSGWGALSQKAQDRSVTIRLAVQHGQIPLRHLRLQTESGSVLSVTRLTGPDGQPISGHSIDVSGRDVHVDFGRPLLLSVGTAVSLELTTIPGTNK